MALKNLVSFTLALVICLLPVVLFAQNSPYPDGNLEVKIKGVATSDGILLRWVPTNYVSWQWGNKYGYYLERYVFRVNDSIVETDTFSKSRIVLGDSIKPRTETQLRTMANTNNLAGVAGAAIYAPKLL